MQSVNVIYVLLLSNGLIHVERRSQRYDPETIKINILCNIIHVKYSL